MSANTSDIKNTPGDINTNSQNNKTLDTHETLDTQQLSHKFNIIMKPYVFNKSYSNDMCSNSNGNKPLNPGTTSMTTSKSRSINISQPNINRRQIKKQDVTLSEVIPKQLELITPIPNENKFSQKISNVLDGFTFYIYDYIIHNLDNESTSDKYKHKIRDGLIKIRDDFITTRSDHNTVLDTRY